MPDYTEQPGGLVPFDTNELVTSAELEDVGWMALQSIYGLLAACLAGDTGNLTDASFLGDGFLCAHSSGMDVTVEAGFGVVEHQSESDAHKPILQPLVLSAQDTQTIDGLTTAGYHRIDVTKGTEVASGSTPSAPSLSAGRAKLAEVYVDTSGAISTVTDYRQPMQWGETLTAGLDSNHANDWVVNAASGDLEVGPVDVGSMDLPIAAGSAYIRGRRVVLPNDTTITVSSNSSGSVRDDVVALGRDGTISVIEGTPGAGVPSLTNPDEQIALATYDVGSGAANPTNLTDLRVPYPFDGSTLADDAVDTRHLADSAVENAAVADSTLNAEKLAFDLLQFGTTVAAEVSDSRDIDIQMEDVSGNTYSGTVQFIAELFNSNMEPHSTTAWDFEVLGTGTTEIAANSSPTNRIYGETHTDGTATVRVTATTGAHTAYVLLRPVNVPGEAKMLTLTFT